MELLPWFAPRECMLFKIPCNVFWLAWDSACWLDRIERMTENEVDVLISLLQDNRSEFLYRIGCLLSPHIVDILQEDDIASRFKFEDCTRCSVANQAFDSEGILEYCHLLQPNRWVTSKPSRIYLATAANTRRSFVSNVASGLMSLRGWEAESDYYARAWWSEKVE